jgi:hypothetical protein
VVPFPPASVLPSPSPERDAPAALRLVSSLLAEQGRLWQIAGGTAARFYGSDRPLADLDIEVPDAVVATLAGNACAARVKLLFAPARYTDNEWCLTLPTVLYHGQEIDFAGVDVAWVRDRRGAVWVRQPADVARAQPTSLDGYPVRTIPRADPVAYKRLIRRDVDLADLATLTPDLD